MWLLSIELGVDGRGVQSRSARTATDVWPESGLNWEAKRKRRH